LTNALASRYEPSVYSDVKGAARYLERSGCDAIILDLCTDEREDLKKLTLLRKAAPQTPIIVTSDREKADFIVKVMKADATDFLAKPYSEAQARLTVDQSIEKKSIKNENDYLRRQQDIVYEWDRIVAVSPAMKNLIRSVKKVAATDSTILMTGPSGSGKSYISGTIHFNSHRREKPFITINCANLPESLLESELFGHEKGAFTGADKTRAGRFEQADGGTVFLDEVGEISPALQAKLLRVLEEKAFERLGGTRTIRSDVRIIAATNRNLERMVAEKTFREDLYYRVNVLRFHLPPLKERQECIEPLAHRLLEKTCRTVHKTVKGFAPEVLDLFKRYSWPGNIRELANVIERAVLLEESPFIQESSILLPEIHSIRKDAPAPEAGPPRSDSLRTLDEHEKELILEALQQCLWIQKDAARILGLTPRTLNYKIKRYGITHHRWRKNK